MTQAQINVSFQSDSAGVYLVETRLPAAIPVGDGSIIQELASQLVNELPDDVGICGTFQPAAWQSDGSLVALADNPTGQEISLLHILQTVEQQIQGIQVPQPYVFNPNLREVLIENGNIVGWRGILLTLPNFGEVGTLSASLGDDGANTQIQSSLEYGQMASMYGLGQAPTGGGMFSWVTNLWDSASIPAKLAIGGAGVVLGVIAIKTAIVAATVGVGVKLLVGALGAAAVGAGLYAATNAIKIIVEPLTQVAQALGGGWQTYTQGGTPPTGMIASLGYTAAASAAAVNKTITTLQQGGHAALDKLNELSNRLDKAQKGAGTILRGLAVASLIAIGGFATYKLFFQRRQ